MIKLDPIKIGDSIIWKMQLKNADNTAVNFQLQFRSEIASSAITLQIGSELHITKVG